MGVVSRFCSHPSNTFQSKRIQEVCQHFCNKLCAKGQLQMRRMAKGCNHETPTVYGFNMFQQSAWGVPSSLPHRSCVLPAWNSLRWSPHTFLGHLKSCPESRHAKVCQNTSAELIRADGKKSKINSPPRLRSADLTSKLNDWLAGLLSQAH